MAKRYKRMNQEVLIKNGVSPKYLFQERAKYERLYPKGRGYPEPIDFWKQKNKMYGFMDKNKNLVYPSTRFIQSVKGSTTSDIFAHDFVCDAFNDFQRYMNGKNGQKLIDDGGRIKKDIDVRKGWQDPISIRTTMDDVIYDAFVREYLKVGNKHRNITDLDSFAEAFFNLCLKDIISEVPLTIAGMLMTDSISPISSGLCLELSTDDQSDVNKIFDTYLNNKNFKTYMMAAAKYGFMVDRNVPFRLVANLSSPKMLDYMAGRQIAYLSTPRKGKTKPANKDFVPAGSSMAQGKVVYHTHQEYTVDEMGNGETSVHSGPQGVKHKHQIINFVVQPAQTWKYPDSNTAVGIHPHTHGLPVQAMPEPMTVDAFFFRYCNKTIAKDIIRLKGLIHKFYNRYVQQFPSTSFGVPCGPIRSRKVVINRITLEKDNFMGEYSDLFFMKLYFIVRLHELKANVTPESIKVNLKKIDTLNNLVDSGYAIDYIDRYMKQFY